MIAPATPSILVDSSVWIEFYRPHGNAVVRGAVVEALANATLFTLPIIVTEVVQGAPDAEVLEDLAMDFSSLEWVPVDAETAVSAARLGFALRRVGRPVPSTHLLIAAAAIQIDAELWHLDRHFETIAGMAPLSQRRF
jgi:predicted nucleic acid-binding protein